MRKSFVYQLVSVSMLVALLLCTSIAIGHSVKQQEIILGGLGYPYGTGISKEDQLAIAEEIMNECYQSGDSGSAARFVIALNNYLYRIPMIMEVKQLIITHHLDDNPEGVAQAIKNYIPASIYMKYIPEIKRWVPKGCKAINFLYNHYGKNFVYRLYHIIISKYDDVIVPGQNKDLHVKIPKNHPTAAKELKKIIAYIKKLHDPLVLVNTPIETLPNNPPFCRNVIKRYNESLPFTLEQLLDDARRHSYLVSTYPYKPLTEAEKTQIIQESGIKGLKFVTRVIPMRILLYYSHEAFDKMLEAYKFISKVVEYF